MHRVAFATLPNGLRAVAIQRPHLHRSVIATYVDVGSRHESRATNGLSHFLEHMLFRGTTAHPSAFALNDAIERLGGSLSAATHGDYTRFELTVPPQAIDDGCALMGSIVTSPAFSQVDVEKGIVREEILENLDDDHRDVNADNLSRLQVFGAHPLGYPITGTLTNVDRFTTADLRAHLRQYYRAANMVVSISSPLSHKVALRSIQNGFRSLRTGSAPPAHLAEVTQHRARIRTLSSAGSQTGMRIAFPTPGDATPLARAVEVLVRVLDDGMSTRLHRRICDELGLAYDVSASVELFRDVGVMDIASGVAHESVARLIAEILTTLGDLAVDGPSQAELDKVKHRYAFDLAAMDDEPHRLADWYGAGALAGRRLGVESRRAEVLAITREDVRRVARVVFAPSRLNLTLVGTVDDETRAKISSITRRFRDRVGAVASPRILPPVPDRRNIELRVRRQAAALDSTFASP